MVESKWIWDNVMSIYMSKGSDYSVETERISIKSHDNYFKCTFTIDGEIYDFSIAIEYSFSKDTQYIFNGTVYSKDREYITLFNSNEQKMKRFIDKLKPVFREFKIEELI